MMRLMAIAAVCLIGCSGSDASSTYSAETTCGAVTPPYAVHFVTTSGNCGDVPDAVDNGVLPAGCAITSSVAAPGGCSFASTETCLSGTRTKVYSLVIQISTSGLVLTGNETEKETDINGSTVCEGSYTVTETKE